VVDYGARTHLEPVAISGKGFSVALVRQASPRNWLGLVAKLADFCLRSTGRCAPRVGRTKNRMK